MTDFPAPVTRRTSRGKRLTLRWRGSSFLLSVPLGMDEVLVQAFLSSRQDWMARLAREAPPPFDGADGDVFSLWGREITVRTASCSRWIFNGETLALPSAASAAERLILVNRFLWDQARVKLPDIFSQACRLFGVPPGRLSIRSMSSRWGSCTPLRRAVRLSVRLVHFPEKMALAVAAHEVAHFFCRGHGAEFRRILESAFPGGTALERQLNGAARQVRFLC